MAKLDARLVNLAEEHTPAADFAERLGAAEVAGAAPQVEVLVRCTPEAVEQLKNKRMQVRARTDGTQTVVSGVAPVDALRELESIPGVQRIEASRPMVSDLDLSRSETGVIPLHFNPLPVRGAGVIVGIIDTGIDYTHADFRNADGSSRILWLWEQSPDQPAHGGVAYGRAFTKPELDFALSSGITLHADTNGHGTHVAGIAAGNGNASQGWFTGIAPDSDIIAVAMGGDKVSLGRSVRAFEAFQAIVAIAQALRRPVVINLSAGMNGGGHCGETLLETGLDNLARQPGVVIVKSAGNEQPWRCHAGGQIAEGQTVALELSVSDNNSIDDLLEVWFDDRDQIRIAIQPPGSPPLGFVAPGGSQQFETPSGNGVSVISEPDNNDTGDTVTTIIIARGRGPTFIQPGTWKVLLRADRIAVGRYDAWIERTSRDQGGVEQTRFSQTSSDNTRTISIPGTAQRIITVGSYITRPGNGSSPLGETSDFSSVGPTRYGLQKPEIAAPGEFIVSARSSLCNFAPFSGLVTYTALPGTSMASPQVAGAAALILSLKPNLTCEQVKQIIQQTARRDGAASGAPDNAWGSGKLNVSAAAERAFTAAFPVIRDVVVDGTTISWQTDVPTTGAVRFRANRRELELQKGAQSQADLTLQTDHRVTLTGLAPGTYFCEIVAFSQENLRTTDDKGGSFYVLNVA